MNKTTAATDKQLDKLTDTLGGQLQRNVELAPFTTFNIGGPAAAFYEAHDVEQLARAITAARACGVDYFLLGKGANILIGDRGHPGLVIRNRAAGMHVTQQTLHAQSGATMYPDVIEQAVSHGLSGLEHYVGIPSTVGGALWQNLHFLSPPPRRERTMFIAEVLESAEILTPDNIRKTVGVDYFDFGYDYSTLHDTADVVLSASFALHPAEPATLREIMRANLDWRAQRHPALESEPSAGSIFRKIEGIGAGRLIDECGLKGMAAGGARISPRHANIIINRGGATAADVCALIMHAQQVVNTRTGHWLVPEIGLVGNFAPVKRIRL